MLEYWNIPGLEFEKYLFFITENDLNHDFLKKNSLLNNYLKENVRNLNLKIRRNEIDNILDNVIQKNLNKLPSPSFCTDYSFKDYLKLRKIRI